MVCVWTFVSAGFTQQPQEKAEFFGQKSGFLCILFVAMMGLVFLREGTGFVVQIRHNAASEPKIENLTVSCVFRGQERCFPGGGLHRAF